MVRTKFPGGRLTAEQYLLADELASTYRNNTIRITTRQDFQFHGVGKANMKPLIKALNERWVTTYGGCGDVARNTMTCPVADLLPGTHFDYQALAQQISDQFMPEFDRLLRVLARRREGAGRRHARQGHAQAR